MLSITTAGTSERVQASTY